VLVVDTNVMVYLLLDCDKTALVRDLWNADPDWWAPRLLVYELANALAVAAKRKAITPDEAATALDDGLGLVTVPEREAPAGRLLEIASKLGVTAYDAAYLAAAEMLQVPLITEDARLLRVAPGFAQSPAEALP
jgi:predicted nucleic acid-binding protein